MNKEVLTAMDYNDIGLIGLAVMGQNLVLNMESHGYRVSVYNRSTEKTKDFIQGAAQGKQCVFPFYDLQSFVVSLQSPKKIMLMVQAGNPVDIVISSLLPLLEKGDILIDGGNSYFKDTIRRDKELGEKGILFMGTGVSGGEEGALKGPSIMPGGSLEAWKQVGKIFTDISAKVDGGIPCCDYIGPDGAGHFVKMTHNGIEYGDMQLICEAYYLMRELLGLSAVEMQKIFAEWNVGKLNSYLIEITADILGKLDPETGDSLVDVILDRAGQKGTGKWTSQEALDLGVAVPTIAEAVFARCMSAIKEERVAAAQNLVGPGITFTGDKDKLIEDIGKALYASKICSYAQGFALLRQAALQYHWDLQLGDIALMWRGGCIIRAQFLNRIKEAYDRDEDIDNLMLDPYFKKEIKDSQSSWRNVVALAATTGLPIPAFSSALFYYDSYRTALLPANLLQAQRDYFGAHTYERTDKEGVFHTQWLEDRNKKRQKEEKK